MSCLAASASWFRVILLFGSLCSVQLSTAQTEPSGAVTPTSPATFDINEFRILGNRVLAPLVIERAVYPFLGPDRDIETVKRAADALEKAYKDSGYGTVFVDIPEQEVSGGIVRLKVTEGRVERVHIRGDRYFSDRQIRAAVPELTNDNTPNLPMLQSELQSLNGQTTDRAVTPVLKAGSEPGTIDVDLDVKDYLPVHGSLQYDNRHTADTTPNRATANISYDNLWQRQDSVAVQYQTAPAKPSDAEVFNASYTAHLTNAGAMGIFSYIRTSSDVLAIGTLGVLGRGSIYGAHWTQPIVSSAISSQSFNGGVDYKDVLTQVLPDASGSASAAVTAPVHYLNWSALYSGVWWRGPQTYLVTTSVGFGVRSLVNGFQQFENARYNAKPDYLYMRMNFSATEALPHGFSVLERASGQWADSALVNNEQFSLGGAESVRGYLEAETLGDSGVAGTLELHSPKLGAHGGPWFSPLYGFIFVDGGVAALIDPLPSQQPRIDLWSLGLGLRIESARGFSGGMDYAVPERTGIRTHDHDGRIDFVMRYGF
jgi:hemolysin activation/secretion protein